MPLNDRARARLKAEKTRRKFSERDLAGMLTWSQSRVAQKLAGRTPITLDELEALCFAVGIAPTEAVRDHGLEFCAEMTPTEFRLFERIRQLPDPIKDGLYGLLELRTTTRPQMRSATPPRPPIKKIR